MRQQGVTVDERLCNVEDLAARTLGVITKQLERPLVRHRVSLHQDTLGALDHSPTAERPLEAVIFRESPQHDVDRTLDFRGVTVGDVGEDSTLRSFVDEAGVVDREQRNHGAGCFTHDPADVVKRVLRALAQPDERDVGTLLARHLAHLFNVELARDHRVTK